MKIILTITAGFFLFILFANAEDKSEFWDEYWDSDSVAVLSSEHPTIDLIYGLGIPRFINDFTDKNFAEIRSAEIKLGFTKKKYDLFNQFGMSYKFTYFMLGTITSEMTSKDKIGNNLKSNLWRIGIGISRGYGYNISEGCDFILYNTGNTFWSKINFKDKDSFPTIKNNVLRIYDDGKFRFSQSFEAGFKFQPFAPLSIGAAYERIIIYPRFMTWYWLGSQTLSGMGQGLIEYFTHKVAKASPGAGPIVHFLLVNAYNYGAYELRKKYMDWPFVTEPPLMYDNWKFGLTLAF